MKKSYLLLLGLLIMCSQVFAQYKTPPQRGSKAPMPESLKNSFTIPKHWVKEGEEANALPQLDYQNLPPAQLKDRQLQNPVQITYDAATELPILIEGSPAGLPELRGAPLIQKGQQYLDFFKRELKITDPRGEFVLVQESKDELQQSHLRLRQQYRGLEVYGGEVLLHLKDDKVYMLNGRYFASPQLKSVTPKITEANALQIAMAEIGKTEKIRTFGPQEILAVGQQVAKKQLVIYHPQVRDEKATLCWYFEIASSFLSRWAYFVDAQTGEVLHKHSLVCKFNHAEGKTAPHTHGHLSIAEDQTLNLPAALDGPATAQATDLLGVRRNINTYQVGTTYFLLDASKDMFQATASKMPDEPEGAIITLDLRNTAEGDAFFLTSANNAWNNPTAVSAHYNAGVAYDYFKKTFNRLSINGRGGNIISLINVADDDGSALDNAYWNGEAMFYGNGKTELRALARSLDVAGHEMSHGVIQNTANLNYENESGALNESFADIFGAMIDRDDWKIGEDVVQARFFPSGALRDMENPNNGGRSLNDPGWQPANYSERYTGTEDNGGVHINSGITNRAFVLFATKVGKADAEQVFYAALSKYLTRSSRFVDARIAVVRAARERGGETMAKAAEDAFTAVGIGTGTATAPPSDVTTNRGTNFVLAVKGDELGMTIFNTSNGVVLDLPLADGIGKKPSISDDGSVVVFINKRKQIRFLEIDWAQSRWDTGTLSRERIWESTAISKDGNRLAVISTTFPDRITVIDLTRSTNNTKEFQLYNPTFTEGVQSGEVVGADAMDWDLSGQTILYDAYNEIKLSGFSAYNYWDMGLLNVWNNTRKTFGDGKIQKIFTGLEEGENVGNPAFAKNTPYIFTFDYIVDANGNGQLDSRDEYSVLAINLESGDVGTIYEDNVDIGFPSYNVTDNQVFFNARSSSGADVVAQVTLATDKINAGTAAPTIYRSNYTWGIPFATGSRILTSTKDELLKDDQLLIYPNPFADNLMIEVQQDKRQEVWLRIQDLLGRQLKQEKWTLGPGTTRQQISLEDLPAGTYVLQLRAGNKVSARKVVKKVSE
jgi:bacillolysin